ncbi:alkaline phosphatase-like [Haliotis rubra]|uniref:alkaline phosphatase-like n=1 Tax=Haliotis rubra TaxID=36100 RepID=UPI001EE62392|nr:alkaline phosphatase-like [Haliotis rubra]
MSTILHVSFVIVVVVSSCNGETKTQWQEKAQAELKAALKVVPNLNVAKNAILFIGDGMGLPSVTAGRILKAQETNRRGQQPLFSFEQFPSLGLSKTYNNDRQTSGSASTGTAYLTGVKANYGTVGVSPAVKRKDCAASKTEEGKLSSIHKWSLKEGKSVGFVTTARVTHASPAAGYANSADRNWEGTTEVPTGCKDIAAQLFDNVDFSVIMGGGRRYILMDNQTDPETNSKHSKQRTDGRDLIKEWKEKNMKAGKKAEYVYNKGQFDAVNTATTDSLLGLFAPSHMSYDLERDKTDAGEPSLAEMTRKAIQILKKNDKGFFLFVEGARIDHGHHNNSAKRALYDVLSLDDAVAAAVTETDEKDTLIVVSADHSHVFGIAGYPSRENDIFGLVDIVPEDEKPFDKMPYTTLFYGNGPGLARTNLTEVDTADINFQQPSMIQMTDDTHGAEDVAIYARGPMSHLFNGVHEENYIAHVIGYASCVGANKDHCSHTTSSSNRLVFSYPLVFYLALFLVK